MFQTPLIEAYERAVLRKWQGCRKLDGILRAERNRFHAYLDRIQMAALPSAIILRYVRWYLRYSLSYRDLEEMMLERGLHVDHTTIYR